MDGITLSFISFGVMIGFGIFGFWQNRKTEKALETAKVPMFLPVDYGTVCTATGERHDWEKIEMVDIFTHEHRERAVCLKCGLIEGEDRQFAPHAIAQVREKAMMLRERRQDEDMIESMWNEEAELLWKKLFQTVAFEMSREPSSGEYQRMRTFFFAGLKATHDIEVATAKRYQEKLAARIPGIKTDGA